MLRDTRGLSLRTTALPGARSAPQTPRFRPVQRTFSLFVAAAGLAGGLGLSTEASAQPACGQGQYQVVQTVTTGVGHNVTRTDSTVQVGDNPVNRFHMVRVVKNLPEQAIKGTILLLPTISNGFPNYEATAEGDYSKSFAAYFARRGYDVWGVAQRTEDLEPGDCESGAVDCSAMESWGLDTFLQDVAFVRAMIGAAHPGKKPVVGGVSLGSIAGTAVIDARPDDYAGALLIEGALYDTDPGTRAITQGFCDAFDGALSQGVYYDATALAGIKLVGSLASADPAGPSPIPGMPPGFTNHQAFVAVMTAPGVGPITPRPDYNFLKGNPFADTFDFANDQLALANIATFVHYTSIRMMRDIDCSLAGDRKYSNNLSAFHGPVFMAGGGHGFGPGMLDTALLLTNANVSVHYEAEYGHMDHFFNAEHRDVLEEPILEWLDEQVFDD